MERSKKKKKNKVFLSIVIVFLILIVGAGAFAFNVFRQIARTTDNIHKEVETENVRDTDINVSEHDPFSILVLGLDTGDLGRTARGRSDSIMVITVNPNKNSTKILGIPRDTRTEIIGRGTIDKINHASAFGGVEMSINTVQNFLNIPIDYFVEVNMQGIQQLVDVLGGVTVNNTMDFTFEGTRFAVGPVRLNGEDALKFSRMRFDDPQGDIGRQGRQRQIIEAILREAANFSSITKFTEILNAIEGNTRTNVTLDEIISISLNYQSALNEIQHLQLVGSGQRINGIWYQVMSNEELSGVSNTLREHLELD